MHKPFSFIVPGNVIFGTGSLAKLPQELQARGLKKVLLVGDHGLKSAGLVEKCEQVLASAEIGVVTCLDVEANPSTETVDKGAELFRQQKLDGIVCLGGGSPMDAGKAMAVLVSHGGCIQDYEGAGKVDGSLVPLIAIPTTAGTGSEVTPFAVITDREKGYKLTVFGNELIPDVALLDPELITTLPATIAAGTGIDALVHAIEAYLSQAGTPFTEMMAEKAMDLIGKNIRSFVANRSDVEAASAMLLGSLFAGIAFSWARLGNVHAMAHPLGGYFNIPHGIANAVLLPTILEYNALADRGKYQRIFDLIRNGRSGSGFPASDLVDEIKRLLQDLDIPGNLSALGVNQEAIPRLAADAMKSGNIFCNPRQTTLEDVERLYSAAL